MKHYHTLCCLSFHVHLNLGKRYALSEHTKRKMYLDSLLAETAFEWLIYDYRSLSAAVSLIVIPLLQCKYTLMCFY